MAQVNLYEVKQRLSQTGKPELLIKLESSLRDELENRKPFIHRSVNKDDFGTALLPDDTQFSQALNVPGDGHRPFHYTLEPEMFHHYCRKSERNSFSPSKSAVSDFSSVDIDVSLIFRNFEAEINKENSSPDVSENSNSTHESGNQEQITKCRCPVLKRQQKRLMKEYISLKEQVSDMDWELKSLEKEIEDRKQRQQEQEKEIEMCRNIKIRNTQLEEMMNRINKDMDNLKTSNEELKIVIENLQMKVEHAKNENQSLIDVMIEETDREEVYLRLHKEDRLLSSLPSSFHFCDRNINEIPQDYEHVKRDHNKGKLQTDLWGDITNSNHLLQRNNRMRSFCDNITASELAETYEEIYNNSWRYAHREISQTEKEEQKVIELLLNILKMAYDFSKEKAGLCKQQLVSAASHIPSTLSQSTLTQFERGFQLQRAVADLQMSVGPLSTSVIENMFLEDLPNFLNSHSVDSNAQMNKTYTYGRHCARLCWLMNMFSPPLFIDFSTVLDGDKYDERLFRNYNKTGERIHYVVWPPMFLNEKGSVLCKGVAQLL